MVKRRSAGTVMSHYMRLVIATSHDAKSGARRRAAVLACVSVMLVSRTPSRMMVEFRTRRTPDKTVVEF